MCRFCSNIKENNLDVSFDSLGMPSENYDSKFFLERFHTDDGKIEWYLHNYDNNDCNDYAIEVKYCPICGDLLQ